MKVNVNDKEVEMEADATVSRLIARLELPPQGIAVAVNNRMVPRSGWERSLLHENDRVVIIKAACGG